MDRRYKHLNSEERGVIFANTDGGRYSNTSTGSTIHVDDIHRREAKAPWISNERPPK